MCLTQRLGGDEKVHGRSEQLGQEVFSPDARVGLRLPALQVAREDERDDHAEKCRSDGADDHRDLAWLAHEVSIPGSSDIGPGFCIESVS